MNRRNAFVALPIITILTMIGTASSDLPDQSTMKGTLKGIREVRVRVPMRGQVQLDVRAMYYEAVDFLIPRAPRVTFRSRSPRGTLQVTFEAVKVPPQTDEEVGFLLFSWGMFISRTDRLEEREYSGPEPVPVNEVEGLVLWQSGPEHTWVEEESDLPKYATRQLELHLNDFLDEWFRDNAVDIGGSAGKD